ncbi:hypothetical protein HanPSC8_Chr11g0450991 [Helianthus annuus]|nr:hypothetical protein HanPSC8_Chr11g0450991 [Helianthus annuus]
MIVPPPSSAARNFPIKSLFGIESKREGFIQPSVTSQPPRLTALIIWLFALNVLPLEIMNKANPKTSPSS